MEVRVDWKVTWMGQSRWFGSQEAARTWAEEQVTLWLTAGAKASPEYRVVYQLTGVITDTLGGR